MIIKNSEVPVEIVDQLPDWACVQQPVLEGEPINVEDNVEPADEPAAKE